MPAVLTDSEIQSLRFHLGYGNIDIGAYPYTPDGFLEVFEQVIAPNLQTAEETTGSTAVAAASTTTVTVGDIAGIVANARLVVDVGDLAEVVVVKSVGGSAFTAYFANAHPASGYPVAVMSGLARLRLLLHSADKAWAKLQSASITSTAGLKSLGKGSIEWFEGGRVLKDTREHYYAVAQSIAELVRVRPVAGRAIGARRIEAY